MKLVYQRCSLALRGVSFLTPKDKRWFFGAELIKTQRVLFPLKLSPKVNPNQMKSPHLVFIALGSSRQPPPIYTSVQSRSIPYSATRLITTLMEDSVHGIGQLFLPEIHNLVYLRIEEQRVRLTNSPSIKANETISHMVTRFISQKVITHTLRLQMG